MGKTHNSWFAVDKEGLAALRASAPKSAMLFELVQNVWDTDATFCKIELIRRAPMSYELRVEDDDINGFVDISHAFTLFAESVKKNDPEKRGRFNLGEKLVLACCKTASIETVGRTILFKADGQRVEKKSFRTVGSCFSTFLKLRRDEFDQIIEDMFRLIPPVGCETSINDVIIGRSEVFSLVGSTEAVLSTVIGDDLRPSRRKTVIDLWDPGYEKDGKTGAAGWIYELGIPVVATMDRYSYNVFQKVPLTLDRTNVTPAFLREVRTVAAEAMVETLSSEDAQTTWGRTAMEETKDLGLVERMMRLRFGAKSVVYDPSDVEANNKAVAHGYTVIHGRNLNAKEWNNVRALRESGSDIGAPAGTVFPTYSGEMADAKSAHVTQEMQLVADFCKELSLHIWGKAVSVRFVESPGAGTLAQFSSGATNEVLSFNVSRLPANFFVGGLNVEVLDLIIHEMGHHFESNHLSASYYNALTKIGALAAMLALNKPQLYRQAMTNRVESTEQDARIC